MLVLEGLVGLHRTVQLLQRYCLGHRLGLLWYWMVLLPISPYMYVNICFIYLKKWKSLSHVQTLCDSWTIQSMEFSRSEYWNGQPFPSLGDLPNPEIEPKSPTLLVDSLLAEPTRESGWISDLSFYSHSVTALFHFSVFRNSHFFFLPSSPRTVNIF